MMADRRELSDIKALFAIEVAKPDQDLDLARAALLLAKFEYPRLDIDTYIVRLDQLANAVEGKLYQRADFAQPFAILSTINEHLYHHLDFRGNKANYYDPKNSFLNEVIDRRLGIPITLSVVYMEIARRLGLHVEGVGMPGHFLMRCSIDNEEIFLDAFNGARLLSRTDCKELLTNIYGQNTDLDLRFLKPVTKREILARMLLNLKNIYVNGSDFARAIAVIDRILIVNPSAIQELRDRGLLLFQREQYAASIKDLEHYLASVPKDAEAEKIRQYLLRAKVKIAELN